MNPEKNVFEKLTVDPLGNLFRPDGTEVPKHWSIFALDELVEIKGYTFRVRYLGETAILFEPVGPVIVGQEMTP